MSLTKARGKFGSNIADSDIESDEEDTNYSPTGRQDTYNKVRPQASGSGVHSNLYQMLCQKEAEMEASKRKKQVEDDGSDGSDEVFVGVVSAFSDAKLMLIAFYFIPDVGQYK